MSRDPEFDDTLDDGALTAGDDRPDRHGSRVAAASGLAAAVIGLVLGVLAGWLVFSPSDPGDTSADAGFARDMHEHHSQAVEMSLLAVERAEAADIVTIAGDIGVTQASQMGRMEAWLTSWGLPQAPADPDQLMAWMGDHEGHADLDSLPDGVRMPGMATPAEMQQLRDATGVEAEILYLQLMTTHHIAGVEMAMAGRELATDSEVVRLATRMVEGQSKEIALMVDKLAERGAEPRETPEEIAIAMQIGADLPAGPLPDNSLPDDSGSHGH